MRGAARQRLDTLLRALGCACRRCAAHRGARAEGDRARYGIAGRRGRPLMQRLYQPVLTSGVLAGALPPRTRVAAIGPDRRWFIDWMVNEGPTAPRCTTAASADSGRDCDLLRVALEGLDPAGLHELLPDLDAAAPLLVVEVPRRAAGTPTSCEAAVASILGELDYTVDLVAAAAWGDGSGTALLVGVHPRRAGPRAQWEVARPSMARPYSASGGAPAGLVQAGSNRAR
jgi:hypothetical protein